MENRLSHQQLQTLASRCPFHKWLSLEVLAITEEGIEILLPWRDELLSSPEVKSVHGGILATMIDVGGGYVIAQRVGFSVPTIDLRVDYHNVAGPGELITRAKAVKIGRVVAVAEARIYDADDRLIASGKSVHMRKTFSS